MLVGKGSQENHQRDIEGATHDASLEARNMQVASKR